MPDLGFAVPWLLLALPLVLLLPRGRGWGWRAASVALLLVALAQPTVGRPDRDVAILVDVSDSVGGEALAALERLDLSALRRPPRLFLLAGDTAAVASTDEEPPPGLEPGATDLARALQVARADGARRVLLLSDGRATRGDALAALPGVPVDTLFVPGRPNARLVGLLAPEQASPGETVEVVAVVESDRGATLTLRPEVGGEGLEPISLEIPAGRTTVPFDFAVEGRETLPVRARLEVSFSQPLLDDVQETEIVVSERQPVLVLGDPAAAELLRAQGFEVVEGGPESVRDPLPFGAIVLRGGAGRFTPGQLELLRSYVENGGGLMMTGGPESFGLGAWYRTPVEEALPVTTDLRTELDLPLVALVIVLDRSQSMSTGNPTKISLAKEGAIGVVDLAYQDDLLGLIAFSDADAAEWVFRLRPATERGKREMLDRILGISTGGGTVLAPAYEMALAELAATDAALKHVIVLTDGKLYDGQGPFGGRAVDFAALAARGRQSRITTSTIAIGERADFDRLRQIALAGGGRYYEALDASTLPRIFTSEALTATRSLLREEPGAPTLRSHPLVPDGVGEPPPLDAYVASSLKEDAEAILEGLEGEPVLAVARRGLGRSAALTTDLNGWAGELGAWPGLPALLGTVARWLQARPETYSASVEREGTELRLAVDAVRDGAYLNDRRLEARYDGRRVPLEQVAPGRYEARLPAGEGGTVVVAEGGEVVARARVSAPSPEFDAPGGEELLREIAARSGGEVITGGRYAPPAATAALPAWPVPALLALALFGLELLLRRFGREPDERAPAA